MRLWLVRMRLMLLMSVRRLLHRLRWHVLYLLLRLRLRMLQTKR
jgi:hypothetical protein